jgi:hypothetical protein
MPIPSSGSVSLQDLEDEFGGAGTISMSEYYRSNTYEDKVTGNNTGVPQSGQIKLSQFRGTENKRYIQYYLCGAGGGGGYGMDDRSGSGSAGDGGDSTITINGTTYTANGGSGGANGSIDRGSSARAGHDAEISDGYFKNFGTSGGLTGNNASASAGSGYVAGGSGGGGDAPSDYDRSGAAGEGGDAGEQIQGTVYVSIGSTISYTLGNGGAKGIGPTYGANGRDGAIVIIKDGVEVVDTGGDGSGSHTA